MGAVKSASNDQAPASILPRPGPRPFYEKPCADHGLESYRYRSRYGFIMIGAEDDEDAMSEAARSSSEPLTRSSLERWNGAKYEPVTNHE